MSGKLTILTGDVRETLSQIESGSVHTCVTSPPYFGLRDYQTANWEGGSADCSHRVGNQVADTKANGAITNGVRPGVDASRCLDCGAVRKDSQIGLEKTPDAYIAELVGVFREVRRCLRDDGTLWVNIGDSFASQGGAHGGRQDNQNGVGAKRTHESGAGDKAARAAPNGLKPKDLIGIPWMLAFALRADGWYLRSDIIWSKKNPMPESVTDRPTKSHEYLFLLSKSERYYYDHEAIKEPAKESTLRDSRLYDPEYDVTRPERGYTGAAQRGSGLLKPKTSASCLQDALGKQTYTGFNGRYNAAPVVTVNKRSVWTVSTKPYKDAHFATYPPELIKPCILAGCPAGGLVLDPFGGSGTTAMVALMYGRRAILCELNPEYVGLAKRRCLSAEAQEILAL